MITTVKEPQWRASRKRTENVVAGPSWSVQQLFLFRVSLVFLLLLIVPLTADWYERLFSIQSLPELFVLISGHRTNFLYIPTESGRWGFLSFAGAWGPALAIAVLVATVWTILARNKAVKDYNKLYYWLRVLVRYRIAVGLIAFGYLKVFPMQMPFPSISNLHTYFGDYTDYKLYWQSVGIVQWYEIFLGWLEVAIGLLFFFRGTIALGAVFAAGVLYNISHANIAYDGGVHVYSAYFVLLSLFLLIPYIPNIWRLFIQEKDVVPAYFYPSFSSQRFKYLSYGLKYTFIISFVLLSLYNRYDVHFNQKRLKEPVTPGLLNAQGYYTVSEFTLNNRIIPYSPVDSIRWQEVIFEKYSTLTYTVFKPMNVDITNGGGGSGDLSRNYELSGIAGGRAFFYYEIDSANQVLHLQNKNTPRSYFDMYSRNFGKPLFKNGDDEKPVGQKPLGNSAGKKKNADAAILAWHYSRPSASRIILSGLNENKDSIYVVLDRVDKKYPLIQQQPVTTLFK